MKETFTFYKALDSVKGSWDGYGLFSVSDQNCLAFVTDAPSGASIHTPEMIKQFWTEFAGSNPGSGFHQIELADALNRLQDQLQQRGRQENLLYQATIVIVQKQQDQLFYSCIGDSVLQILRDGKLYRLSESEIWDSSLIVQSNQTARNRQKTLENRFIGSNGAFIQTSEIGNLTLKDQDILLLYTDGVEDLLTPDQILRLLVESPENMRKQMDDTFHPGRIKDDATFVAIPVQIPATIPIEKELATLRTHLDQIQKDQSELRKQLLDFGNVRARLDKVENALNEASRANKRTMPSGSGVSSRKQQPLSWLIAVLCLLLGTAVGALLSQRATPKSSQTPVREIIVPKKTVSPPEIPPETDCNYTVQKGDSLEKIASSKNISIDHLLKLNPAHKRDTGLKIGQTILVCAGDSL